jgi:PAS domain S-box-containing protein
MAGSYAYGLVALSVVIAVLASYVALDLAGRVTAATGRTRRSWITGGAFAMGTGIWSMHYIGMLAFALPVPVQYDWPTVVLSLIAAILASAVAMFVTSRTTMGLWRAALGSIFMGTGIAGMHYIGMAAMRLPATHSYDPTVVVVSVLLAVAISFVALGLTFRLRDGMQELDWRKIGSSIVMGAAIPVMHYTGMAAVTFAPQSMAHDDLSHAVSISSLGIIGIIGVTFMVLGLAVVTALVDRRRSAQVMREDARLRHNEARLREDAERREFILSAAAIGMWEQDLTTHHVTWSDTMELIHGIPRRDFPRTLEAFLQRIHPDDQAELRHAFTQGALSASQYTTAYRSVWPDGSIHWVESTARITRDAEGRPTQVVGVDRDITARKLAEAALVESERGYRSTFEGAPVGIAHVALNGQWLRVNRRLCEILGYSREELLALDVRSLLHPEDFVQEAQAFADVASGTLDRYHGEKRFRRRDGTYVWTLLNVAVHRDEENQPRYIIPIIDDITDRHTLEAQFRQAQKMDAVGQLAGGIAHDFNNLLTVIIGFSELILDNPTIDQAGRRDLDQIAHSARLAAVLTSQLLAFSRRQTLEPRILDLNAVIAGMEGLLGRLIGEQVELVTQLAPGLGRVSADQSQIEQVVMNLAVNARDAMPGGGIVRIETGNVDLDDVFVAAHPGASRGSHVTIAVIDSGVGIDRAMKARLFEPFYTTKEQGKGTGLGLATVYGVVKQSKGYIGVESEVGRGSTFTVYLPGVAQSVSRPVKESASVPLTGTERILLVEDQDEVRRIACEALTRHGYMVLEASSGDQALALIEQHAGSIQLVLTDVVMPGMDGRELGRRIGLHHQDVRILYMSGYADAVVGEDGVLVPGLAFLRKPFTPKRLLQKVREVLDESIAPCV